MKPDPAHSHQVSHPASKLGDERGTSEGVGATTPTSFLGQGHGSTPLAGVSPEAVLGDLRRMEDSEGNEDSAQGMPGVRSAAGSVRPDPHSAAAGLGEDEPVAASGLPPRIFDPGSFDNAVKGTGREQRCS